MSESEDVIRVKNILSKYDPEDLSLALFAFSSWNRNRTAELKLLWISCVFIQMPIEIFQRKKIINFADLDTLCKELISSIPDYYGFQDNPCTGDWGEIRYFFEGEIKKTFYGTGLSWGYDLLKSYEMIYGPFDKEIVKLIGKSPINELGQCLKFTDLVLKTLPDAVDRNVSSGHLETPSLDFWKKACEFCESFPKNLDQGFVSHYTRQLGTVEFSKLNEEIFFENYHNGKGHNFIFIGVGTKSIPINPRRTMPVLIETWNILTENLKIENFNKDKPPIGIRIGARVARYTSDRIKKDNFFRIASVGKFKEKPKDFIFPLVILDPKQILLFAFTDPFSEMSTHDQLSKFNIDFSDLEEIFNKDWSIHLHLDNQQIMLRNDEGLLPKFKFITIVPNKSAAMSFLRLPKKMNSEVWYLEQFLILLDELEKPDEISSFIEFKQNLLKKTHLGMLSMADAYAAFKDSNEVLIEGAVLPNFMMIDPNWATERRYKTLSEFWDGFPKSSIGETDPRTFKIKKNKNGRVLMESRSNNRFLYSFDIARTTVFITAPMDDLEFEQKMLLDLAMQALSDALIDYKEDLVKHSYFQQTKKLTITFISDSFLGKKSFEYLNHISSGEVKTWIIECGEFDIQERGMRFVINLSWVKNLQRNAQDRSLDIDLFLEVLKQASVFFPDMDLDKTIKLKAKNDRTKPARYTVLEKEKSAAFPIDTPTLEPEERDYKTIRNEVAQIAKNLGVLPGQYDLTEAKAKLNILVKATHDHLLKRLSSFAKDKSIPLLIAKIDALVSRYELNSLNHTQTKGRDIEFDPALVAVDVNTKFIEMHKSYRLLIEATVLLDQTSGSDMRHEDLKELLALSNWFHVFSIASDQIHYKISPASIEITDGFLVNIEYDPEDDQKMSLFAESQKKKELGLIGNFKDHVKSPRETQVFVDKINLEFKADLGFNFITIIHVLKVLSFWPQYVDGGSDEQSFYHATVEEIVSEVKHAVQDATDSDIKNVIQFLTLKKENILKIVGDSRPAPMIPIWELFKRHSRYNIRPLIQLDKKIVWGAHSVERAGKLWAGAPTSGRLPINLNAPRIDKLISEEKKLMEDALVEKAGEIARRYTKFVDLEVKLHKRDKVAGHPLELGDYDLLCFLPKLNLVVAIECKHLLQVHSLKDAASLREDIFGSSKRDGYLKKIENRAMYLENNLEKIFFALGWAVSSVKPECKSIHVSIHSYFWTFAPPVNTKIQFLEIDSLDDFFKNLCEKKR